MGNYEQLKQAVSSVIKNNGNMEITGDILQNTLLSIISTVGANAAFAGIATPTTNPGTPDGPVFYLAFKQGTYSNFNGIVLDDLDIKVLYNYNDGKWYSLTLGIKTFTHNFINIYNLLGGTYTFEEAVAAIPSKVTNPALLYFRNKNNEYELYEVAANTTVIDKKFRPIGSKALNVLNKKISINLNNVEFEVVNNNSLHLKISSTSFVYLKKNNATAQELSYLILNPCDVTSDLTNKAIALSDTPDTYTKCTYTNSIYIVTNPLSTTYADDVVAFIVNKNLYAIPELLAKWQVTEQVNSLSEQVTEMGNEIQEINNKLEEPTPTEDNEQIEEKEYWIRVQGNTFDSSELFLGNGATTFDNSVLLNAATYYVALNKIYWSDRRIHKFIVTPTTLGTLVINLAQNTSNAMYPTFTGGNWTSAFKIDFSNKKIYMGDNIEFDMSSMNIVAGRKYIIELKYIKRVFYVTITDFLNYDSYTAMLDARDSNKNGGFKNTLIIQNQSGNYTVEQIETYEVANPTLVLFGDSVTEAIGRVGKGQNYSEIISEKIKSCTIIAQGGAGASSWDNIFENEIKHIKPKYCSYNMGLNGGLNNTNLKKFITDCESIGTIPILNHVICTKRMDTGGTQESYNDIIDEVVKEKGYMGYYGDIATATNNDVSSQLNYIAKYAADGKFNIAKTAMSKSCFNTYTIQAGKTVIENEEERILNEPLEVIMGIHPNTTGHKLMADRYMKDIILK